VVNVAGHVALSLASVALLVFTRRIFRPDAPWARRLVWLGGSGALAALALLPLDGGAAREDAPSLLALNALRTLTYAWSFAEALHYWRQMRRREALGLADPLVVNRFLLWSIWSGGFALCFGLVLLVRLAGRALGAGAEILPSDLPMIRVVLGAVVFASAAALWLCFFPPRAYVARLASPAART
jgi:hypothetical protein